MCAPLHCFDQGNGVGSNAKSLAGKAQMLLRGGLYAYRLYRQTESRRQIGTHGRDMGCKLGALAQQGGVDILDAPAVLLEDLCHAAGQFKAVGTGILRVIVREMLTDIPQRRCAQHGIHHRMGQTDQWASKLFNVKGRYNDPSLKGAWRSAIIAICDAAERFSETKTGALIVLERHTNLSEIVRTGTPVNSAVNLEVLGTIFYEGTPLHDGAAIIENGRIKAAGCVLPLSNNLDLGKDMGTRHRACLGIAENSDAIAIVVSEETGIISMAKNGVLIRHFDRQSLYTRLIDEMIPKESTVEKNTADSWVEQAKKLWNWISQKGEDEQQ